MYSWLDFLPCGACAIGARPWSRLRCRCYRLVAHNEEVKMQVQWCLTAAVSVLTLISGVFWIRSATARVLYDPNRRDRDGMLAAALIDDSNGVHVDVLETARLQSKWNKWAALFAGFTAMLQAVSSIFFS